MLTFKNIFYYFSAAFFAIGIGAFAPMHAGETTKSETLTIGLQSGYPPFEYLNEKGKVVGFDVDLAEVIAQKLGKKLVIKDLDFDSEILSLKQGKIDLILSGMNITPSRQKEIAMVPYHGEAVQSMSLVFWGKIPSEVHALEDIKKLPNGVIAVETGSIAEAYLQQISSLKTKSFEGALAPLMDVKLGKSTADLVEPDVAIYLKGKYRRRPADRHRLRRAARDPIPPRRRRARGPGHGDIKGYS